MASQEIEENLAPIPDGLSADSVQKLAVASYCAGYALALDDFTANLRTHMLEATVMERPQVPDASSH